MRRLPRPIAIGLAGLVCGVIGAAVFSALGGVVAGEDSCDIGMFRASRPANAMYIGVYGGVVGLAVGGLIAGVGVFLSARQNLMPVEAGLIAVVAVAGGGPFQLLGSVSLNGADHERCISGALLGGFVGAALGMLVGIYVATKTWSPRPLLASFASLAAISVVMGLLLWRYVGWTP